MSDEPRRITHQQLLQARAGDSNVQPYMYGKGGLTDEQIARLFTTPEALALVGLRKEGDHYVRN